MFLYLLFFGGKPLEIIRLLLKGEIEVYVSPFIVWEESRIEKILDIITTRATEVYPNFRVSVISGKDDDNRILECALEGRYVWVSMFFDVFYEFLSSPLITEILYLFSCK
ncbi:MAG: hypothetical protein ACP5RW_09765 [bacterium]